VDAPVTAPGFDHSSHGPLAEEAAKLAEALSSWASSGFAHSLFAGAAGASGLSGAGESTECTVCPLCQLLRLVKGSKPEVFEHLTDASASLIAALRAALESSQASWTAGSRPTSERIDIR
jgi:hypothetical protein